MLAQVTIMTSKFKHIEYLCNHVTWGRNWQDYPGFLITMALDIEWWRNWMTLGANVIAGRWRVSVYEVDNGEARQPDTHVLSNASISLYQQLLNHQALHTSTNNTLVKFKQPVAIDEQFYCWNVNEDDISVF
jgi:hypothetical protein